MVICDKYGVVYLGLPTKTGVVTVTSILTQYFEGKLHTTKNYKGLHHRRCPDKCKSYQKLATCRNPYARAVSYWSFWRMREIVPQKAKIQSQIKAATSLGFNDFLKSNNFFKGQVSQLRSVKYSHGGRIPLEEMYLMRLENLSDYFSRLDFTRKVNYNMNKENSSEHEHFSKYYDAESEEFVWNNFREDFETFGYSRWEGIR